MKGKPSSGYRVFQAVNTILMIFVIFITLYPFIYLTAQSFSSDAAVSAGKVTFFPIDFNLDTYKYILRDNQFFKYYFGLYFCISAADGYSGRCACDRMRPVCQHVHSVYALAGKTE